MSPNSPQYAGRYKVSDGFVLIVKEVKDVVNIRPIFWRSALVLRRTGEDSFTLEDRNDRLVEFIRDEMGCVAKIKLTGFGDDGAFPRLGREPVPVELLFAGQPARAAAEILKAAPGKTAVYLEIADNLRLKFPSKSMDAARFLETLVKRYPQTAALYAALGNAYVATGNRSAARSNFRRAYKLDANSTDAIKGLRRLNDLPPSAASSKAGWNVPFSLDDLFRRPTREEIEEVEAIWSKRDLSPVEVNVEARGRIDLGAAGAAVQIISHRVHGQKHYGAIIVPDGIDERAPVILDLKGVSWDFFPLDLDAIISPKILGARQNEFIYFVPSFRGEILRFEGREYISEGDRTDSWDGATDDSLAFLNAALSITPQADANRLCAFGKSRGGSLALLAGIRNSNIRFVVDWAGPVDWFELMGTEGWTQKEIARDALLNQAVPKEEGGQFIEKFLAKSINGNQTLHEARLKMLASSPIYFARRLPERIQIHYGVEDEMVPLVNGRELLRALNKKGRNSTPPEAFFYPASGHDLDKEEAYRQTRNFLLKHILRRF